MKLYVLIFTLLFSSFTVQSQCLEGETEVFVNVFTDNWGYETYWQLANQGEACEETPLYEAGNILEVSCFGPSDGIPATGGNGYASNEVFIEGPFCLVEGQEYDLIFVDDYGDGGLIFEVIQEGVITSYLVGTGEGNTFTFTAGDLTPAIHKERILKAL